LDREAECAALGNVFAKLDITSRRELRQALPDRGRGRPMA
jgi:hypothetical protein